MQSAWQGPRSVMLLHYLLLPDHLLSHYRTHNTTPSAPHITASQCADFELTYVHAHVCIPRPAHYIASACVWSVCVRGRAHHISVKSGNTPFNFALINFTSPLNHKMLPSLFSAEIVHISTQPT
jgi:hypothetical protein